MDLETHSNFPVDKIRDAIQKFIDSDEFLLLLDKSHSIKFKQLQNLLQPKEDVQQWHIAFSQAL